MKDARSDSASGGRTPGATPTPTPMPELIARLRHEWKKAYGNGKGKTPMLPDEVKPTTIEQPTL